jgi:DNA-binding transcriptional regulator YhcF (GntR family)
MRATSIDDRTNTIATQLIHRHREEIISGTLQSGAKINLAAVRESLGVSLSPLREALARLTAEGLVEFKDNRGNRVAPVSIANLAEVTQLRIELESLALRHAMANGDFRREGDVVSAAPAGPHRARSGPAGDAGCLGGGASRFPPHPDRRLRDAAAAEHLPRAAQPQRPLPPRLSPRARRRS